MQLNDFHTSTVSVNTLKTTFHYGKLHGYDGYILTWKLIYMRKLNVTTS